MISRILTVCSWFGSDRPGFFSGTLLLVVVMLSLHAAGIQASLSLGPDGNLPRLRDIFLFALSHDDAPSLLVNVCCLLLVGPCQERRWGTVAFLGLAAVSWAAVPCAYSLVLWVGVGDASRVCGYSAVQLALFTAQCRQVKGRRLGCVPVWLLPWTALLLALLLLPGTPALLHFCAICIGHNYSVHFIGTLQELERFSLVPRVPEWAFISSFSRIRLPTHSTSHRSSQPSEPGPPVSSYHPFSGTGPGMDLLQPGQSSGWSSDHFHHGVTEVEVLEEQMFRAGILASLQDYPDSAYSLGSSHFPETTSGDRYSLQEDPLDSPQAKVELPKSSVSSLRLQQLQRMGFCTEKAVVALAASKQLEGAVSLLVHDSIGPEAVVVGAAAPGPSPHR